MATLEEIVTRFEITQTEISMWIEEGWVEPQREGTSFVFDESDTARVGLILELKRDLEIDESAMPVVLSLLDQLHAARAALKRITGAIGELPPDIRDRLSAILGDHAIIDDEGPH